MMGKAGAGKDAVGKILVDHFSYTRLAFADLLKDMAKDIGWNGEKDKVGRELLQNLGLAARNHLGADVWVTPILTKALDIVRKGGRVVITDVRFPNEWAAVLRQGVLWRVERPNLQPVNNHISETALDGHRVDELIVNDGTLTQLAQKVSALI
jgi:hypothetical protein